MVIVAGLSEPQQEVLVALFRLSEKSTRFFDVSRQTGAALVRRGLAEDDGMNRFRITDRGKEIVDKVFDERPELLTRRYDIANLSPSY